MNISCSPRCSIICVRSRVSSMEKLGRWNICWHVTITMTHYLLTAATSNGQKCQVTFTESSQFLHLWATASCACAAGPWTRYGVYQAKSFLYHGHLPFSFFHGPGQHLGGGICYVVASWCAAKLYALLGCYFGRINSGVRCWLVPKTNILKLYPISLQLQLSNQLWTRVCDCMHFDYCQMCEWATLRREH